MFKTLLTFSFFIVVISLVQAEEPIDMASHMAVYDLQMESASDKSGITGIAGRMAYEFNGSPCEGFTTRFRFVTRINMEEGPARLTDQQTTTFESANGKEFHFVSKTIIDGEVTNETDGVAKIVKNDMNISLKKPNEVEHKLKPAEFPTIQTEEVIRKARAGEHFYRTVLFDGSDDADRLTEVSVVIGDKKKPEDDGETKLIGKLRNQSFWPVTISYFNDDENQEGLPVYRTSFLLYENGVTRNLIMDYGNFSIRGRLKSLEFFENKSPSSDCKT